MIPTARAVELIEPVRKVLRDIEVIVAGRSQFDAVSAKHRYAIGANDYVEYFLLPGLMKELQEGLQASMCISGSLTSPCLTVN